MRKVRRGKWRGERRDRREGERERVEKVREDWEERSKGGHRGRVRVMKERGEAGSGGLRQGGRQGGRGDERVRGSCVKGQAQTSPYI